MKEDGIIIALMILVSICLLSILFYRICHPPWPIEGMDNKDTTSWPLDMYFSISEQNELKNIVELPLPPPEPVEPDVISMFTKENEKNLPAEYKKLEDLPLRELTMKGAFNSAYDGYSFTIAQLGKVMANGSRYLDFQLFMANDGALYVSHSDTPRASNAETSLTFSEVLKYLSQYAFSYDKKVKSDVLDLNYLLEGESKKSKRKDIKAGSPIQDTYIEYPLFINIRINRPNDSNTDIIDVIYKNYLNPESQTPIIPISYFYRVDNQAKPVDMGTILGDLKKKIVFMMDIDNIIQNYTTSFNADDVPVSVRQTMRKFVNVFTGGHTWKSYMDYDEVYSSSTIPLYAMDNGFRTNSDNLYIAYPSVKNSRNPDALKFISDYRIQLSPNRHYIKDTNWKKYEKFFNDMKKPFVPLAHAIKYNNGVITSETSKK